MCLPVGVCVCVCEWSGVSVLIRLMRMNEWNGRNVTVRIERTNSISRSMPLTLISAGILPPGQYIQITMRVGPIRIGCFRWSRQCVVTLYAL